MNKKQIEFFLKNIKPENFKPEFKNKGELSSEYKKIFCNKTVVDIKIEPITENKNKIDLFYKTNLQDTEHIWLYVENIENNFLICHPTEYLKDISFNWRTYFTKKYNIQIKFDYEIKKELDYIYCETVDDEIDNIIHFLGVTKIPDTIYVFDNFQGLKDIGFNNIGIYNNSVVSLEPNDPELLVKYMLQNLGLTDFLVDGIAVYYNNFVSKNTYNGFNFNKDEIDLYIKKLKKLHCKINYRKAILNTEYYNKQKYLLFFILKMSKVKISSNDYWKVYPANFINFLIKYYGVDKFKKFVNNYKLDNLKKRFKLCYTNLFWLILKFKLKN